jgi:nucleotide-binding universal stress UspA family protein
MQIVAGVDGSDTADTAALVAARLADALGAELHLLSAYRRYQVEHFEGGTIDVAISTKDQAQSVVERTARRLRKVFPGVTVHTTPKRGKPADVLVGHAEDIEADLIVVGNKRVQGVARILGSIAKDVTALAPCDVYVAHTHAG